MPFKNHARRRDPGSNGEAVLFLSCGQSFKAKTHFLKLTFMAKCKILIENYLVCIFVYVQLSKLKKIQQHSWLPSQFCINFNFSFS